VVFTSTQRDADWLASRLYEMGHAVAPLHGGMPQGRRNRTLMALRRGELRVLVATDVAARGIDVPTISHVINYGMPMKAEDYVHRIGRTGRAGRSGLAVTLAERGDVFMIKRIQHFTTQAIPVATVEGLEPKFAEPKMQPHQQRPGGPGRFDHQRRGGGGHFHQPHHHQAAPNDRRREPHAARHGQQQQPSQPQQRHWGEGTGPREQRGGRRTQAGSGWGGDRRAKAGRPQR